MFSHHFLLVPYFVCCWTAACLLLIDPSRSSMMVSRFGPKIPPKQAASAMRWTCFFLWKILVQHVHDKCTCPTYVSIGQVRNYLHARKIPADTNHWLTCLILSPLPLNWLWLCFSLFALSLLQISLSQHNGNEWRSLRYPCGWIVSGIVFRGQ